MDDVVAKLKRVPGALELVWAVKDRKRKGNTVSTGRPFRGSAGKMGMFERT